MFINWYIYVETQYGYSVKQIRCNNGREFVNDEFHSFLKRIGLVYQRTVPGNPYQDGVAERRIRTVKSEANCILDQALSKYRELLNPEALKHVGNMLNITPFDPNTSQCPASILGALTT